MEKIAEGIYYIECREDKPAMGVVCSEEYSVLIDLACDRKELECIKEQIKELGFGPIKYAIITHHHKDHIVGINEQDGIEIISSKKTKDFIKQADVVFENKFFLNVGDKTCILQSIDNSHTEDGTFVYLKEDKVLFLGDALYTGYKENKVYYDMHKTTELITHLGKVDVDTYVFGHDELCEPTRKGMLLLIKQIEGLKDLCLGQLHYEKIVHEYRTYYKKEPSSDELFVIQSFVNGNSMNENTNSI